LSKVRSAAGFSCATAAEVNRSPDAPAEDEQIPLVAVEDDHTRPVCPLLEAELAEEREAPGGCARR
jgi:hypothetical protein